MAREVTRPIVGAYHVATFPDWREIALAQCRRLQESGLLAKTSRLLVGVVGEPDEDLSALVDALGPRAELRRLGPLSSYEFPTLQWLYDEAQSEDLACWYAHTKGVCNRDEARTAHRLRMEEIVFDQHEACLNLLETYDTCGQGWRRDGFGVHNPHYSGNFWWANARYVRTLPPPSTLNAANRFEAEFWIGKNPAMQPFNFAMPADAFDKPSAWVGLETKYRALVGDIGPVRRIVELGVDYGFSTFHFALDYPDAEVIGVDNFTLHDDAEAWVRDQLPQFPNVQIIKGSTVEIGRSFRDPVDLLHIDADHEYESVVGDFSAWLHVVRPGGRVLFHDTVTFPSVGKFFHGLGGEKREIPEHHGLGCWIKT